MSSVISGVDAKDVPEPQKKELLKTGYLSDATIECGGRVWKVHRFVLGVASPYFRAALLGGFKETQTGIIFFPEEDFDPININYLLEHIYGADTSNDILQDCEDSSNVPARCAELAVVADYFHVPSLHRAIAVALVVWLDCHAILACHDQDSHEAWQEKFREDTLLEDDPDLDWIEHLFEAVDIAYAYDIACMRPIRSCFVSFVWVLSRQLLDCPQIIEGLHSHPRFHQDLTRAAAFGQVSPPSAWLPEVSEVERKIEENNRKKEQTEASERRSCESSGLDTPSRRRPRPEVMYHNPMPFAVAPGCKAWTVYDKSLAYLMIDGDPYHRFSWRSSDWKRVVTKVWSDAAKR